MQHHIEQLSEGEKISYLQTQEIQH